MGEPGELEREAVEIIARAAEDGAAGTPWYREARGIVSVLAILVSASSFLFTWQTHRSEEVHQKRQEFRQIVQELTEMRLHYIADLARITDEGQRRGINSVLGAKQNILLEAAEALVETIPDEVTASAYLTLAWENVNGEHLAQAERFFRAALHATGSPTGRTYAHRDLGLFLADYRDELAQARETFQLGVRQLDHEWDPAAHFALADTYESWGGVEQRKGDAAKGQELLQAAQGQRAQAQAVLDARNAARGAPPVAGPLPIAPPRGLQSASVLP